MTITRSDFVVDTGTSTTPERTAWKPKNPSLGCKLDDDGKVVAIQPEPHEHLPPNVVLDIKVRDIAKEHDTIAKHIAQALDLTDPLSIEFLKETFRCATVFDSKQHDYGPGNIAAFMDYGCLVRMSDKVNRMKHLYAKDSPKHESVDDSFLDAANYSIIALMCRKGIWPK